MNRFLLFAKALFVIGATAFLWMIVLFWKDSFSTIGLSMVSIGLSTVVIFVIYKLWTKYTVYYIAIGILVSSGMLFFLSYKLNYPDLSLREYYHCELSEEVKSYGAFRTSETLSCVKSDWCSDDGGFISCESARPNQRNGYRIIDPKIVHYFDFDAIKMDDADGGWRILDNRDNNTTSTVEDDGYCGYNIVHRFLEPVDDVERQKALLIDINDQTYFLWKTKGNGRFFVVDKETFTYLGYDRYQDKNGFIYKNQRVDQLPDLEITSPSDN